MDGWKIHVVLAQSTSVPQIPERSGVVRVNQYKQILIPQGMSLHEGWVYPLEFESCKCCTFIFSMSVSPNRY